LEQVYCILQLNVTLLVKNKTPHSTFPKSSINHSASSSIETQKSILKLILPNIEYSKIHEGEKDFKSRISEFHPSKQQTDLEWLLQTIEQSNQDSKTQAFIYNQLGIFIQWKVSSEKDSISFLRGAHLPSYFHSVPLDKKYLYKRL